MLRKFYWLICLFYSNLLQVRSLGNRVRRPTDIRFSGLYLEDYMDYMVSESFKGFKLKHRCFIFTTSAKADKENLGWGSKGGIVDHSRHTLENRSLDNSKKKSLPG